MLYTHHWQIVMAWLYRPPHKKSHLAMFLGKYSLDKCYLYAISKYVLKGPKSNPTRGVCPILPMHYAGTFPGKWKLCQNKTCKSSHSLVWEAFQLKARNVEASWRKNTSRKIHRNEKCAHKSSTDMICNQEGVKCAVRRVIGGYLPWKPGRPFIMAKILASWAHKSHPLIILKHLRAYDRIGTWVNICK